MDVSTSAVHDSYAAVEVSRTNNALVVFFVLMSSRIHTPNAVDDDVGRLVSPLGVQHHVLQRSWPVARDVDDPRYETSSFVRGLVGLRDVEG